MKAAVLSELRKPLEIRDVPIPRINNNEVLIETKACGMCGTDPHLIAGYPYKPKLPIIPGHEPAGVVKAIGSSVRGFKEGDRVVPHLFITCGKCWYCRSGRDSMCSNIKGIIGVLVDGAFAQYFKAPAENLFKLPDSVPFEEGGLLADAIVTSVHAVYDRANIQKGQTVAVIGIGGVGQIVVQLLKNLAVKVVAIGLGKRNLSVAADLGADLIISARDPNIGIKTREFGSDGVDRVIDCVGSNESMKEALACVRRCGRIVMVGEAPMTHFPADTIRIAQHELELIGSRNGSRKNMEKAIELLRRGKVKPIISNVFPLEQINKALQVVRRAPPGRVVIRVDS